MTNEEAIKAMTKYMPKGNDSVSLVLREAMNMGIKALEQESCEDCISREEAEKLLHCGCAHEIWDLPSVQPKPNMSVIEGIKAEIDKEYDWLIRTKCTLYDIDIAFGKIKAVIDNHISGKGKRKWKR